MAFGLVWFQPWKLVVDHRVDEQLPAVARASPAGDESTAGVAAPSGAGTRIPSAPGAVLLARGTLISHEHPTSGTVSVVRRPDGSRHRNLGTLKGNLGNQLYRIPKDADLTRLTSVSIW